MTKPCVLIIFGGRSGEHSISCATAAGILSAIDRSRYDVITAGITPEGRWVVVPDNPDLYRLEGADGITITGGEVGINLIAGQSSALEIEIAGGKVVSAADLGRIDVVFPLLHGPYGEDGTIQGLFEMVNVKYVGCGVLASAACMDKHTTKTMLTSAGLPAGRWELVTARQWRENRMGVLERLETLGMPVFVKPARAGSSLGITKVATRQDLAAAIEEAQKHDPRVVVESMLTGLEVEVAVLGGRGGSAPRTTTAGCIRVAERVDFYDYKTKYIDHDAVSLQIPAPLPPEMMVRTRELAAAAFDALGCEGLARVDFFANPQTGEIVVNEINTMPGFTPYSMYPMLWQAQGMGYTELVTELIELALDRPYGLR
ncbi:MAG: D-alanine--D-alanine ligase family protein [Actinomycetaceae bacterium]|nr:D-alanine--D-alanine ligase family protein [Actinomycetaceae bacterium]